MSGARVENQPQPHSGPPALPEYARPLAAAETFQFRCHPGVVCFTDCCRQLDLALTPYDVLRLAKNLGLSGADFLEQYAVIEEHEGESFPLVYLGMVDDGRASCPFVSAAGCGVYPDRPGACRTYPLGRGSYLAPDGSPREIHVLLTEPHCQGFQETASQTACAWQADQGLAPYNAMNDEMLMLFQNPRVKAGWRPTAAQRELYLDTLYRLENFKAKMAAAGPVDDESCLRSAVTWLRQVFYGG